jgi:hypothetical protein
LSFEIVGISRCPILFRLLPNQIRHPAESFASFCLHRTEIIS